MAYSIAFLARGVCGNLPIVTLPRPDCTIFSTSRRTLRRSRSRFFRTLAATPEPSFMSPNRMCSVPMYSWLKRCASWLASCITLRARSVKRSYMVSTPSRFSCQQLLQMRLHRLCQYTEIVPAFQATHQATAAVRLRHVQHLLRQPDEVLDFQSQRTDGIECMCIETGADQDKLRLDLVRRFL